MRMKWMVAVVLVAIAGQATAGFPPDGKLKSSDGRYWLQFFGDGSVSAVMLVDELDQVLRRTGNKKESTVTGAWRYAEDVCWVGEGENKKRGSLLLYWESAQCCMYVEAIGSRYVFDPVWVKGSGGHCGYKLLNSAEPTPNGVPQAGKANPFDRFDGNPAD